MTIEERYKEENSKMQERLRQEIAQASIGNSKRNIGELNLILEEIVASYSCKGRKMYFPRQIVDSWDFSDQLGEDLLKLNELYNKWK